MIPFGSMHCSNKDRCLGDYFRPSNAPTPPQHTTSMDMGYSKGNSLASATDSASRASAAWRRCMAPASVASSSSRRCTSRRILAQNIRQLFVYKFILLSYAAAASWTRSSLEPDGQAPRLQRMRTSPRISWPSKTLHLMLSSHHTGCACPPSVMKSSSRRHSPAVVLTQIA